MAPKSYDAQQTLYFDPETFNAETNQWIKDRIQIRAKPTYLQAHRKYLDMLSVSRMVTVLFL